MRRDRDLPRTCSSPRSWSASSSARCRRGWCEGLFVTTGIPGRPVQVTDELIKALALLRERHRFARLHPRQARTRARTPAQIERLTALASRVSINFEAPCGASLAPIAPEKSFDVTRASFERVRGLVVAGARSAGARPAGRPAPSRRSVRHDHAVRRGSHPRYRPLLHRHRGRALRKDGGVAPPALQRVPADYPDTPMEERARRTGHAGAPALPGGLPPRPDMASGRTKSCTREGNLPLAIDPKAAWALAHPERFPVEVRTAPYGAAAPRAGHRTRHRAGASSRSGRQPPLAGSPTSAGSVSSLPGRPDFSPSAAGASQPPDGPSSSRLLGAPGRGGGRVSPDLRGEPRHVPVKDHRSTADPGAQSVDRHRAVLKQVSLGALGQPMASACWPSGHGRSAAAPASTRSRTRDS